MHGLSKRAVPYSYKEIRLLEVKISAETDFVRFPRNCTSMGIESLVVDSNLAFAWLGIG